MSPTFQHVLNTCLATESKAIHIRPTDHDGLGAECESFCNICTAADTGVEDLHQEFQERHSRMSSLSPTASAISGSISNEATQPST